MGPGTKHAPRRDDGTQHSQIRTHPPGAKSPAEAARIRSANETWKHDKGRRFYTGAGDANEGGKPAAAGVEQPLAAELDPPAGEAATAEEEPAVFLLHEGLFR